MAVCGVACTNPGAGTAGAGSGAQDTSPKRLPLLGVRDCCTSGLDCGGVTRVAAGAITSAFVEPVLCAPNNGWPPLSSSLQSLSLELSSSEAADVAAPNRYVPDAGAGEGVAAAVTRVGVVGDTNADGDAGVGVEKVGADTATGAGVEVEASAN
ncbi:unnamed protein product [Peronospora belbahrii]|uniref:Hydrophobin n=1 Tax=Peronospora belbahrii TaxID=622444 RepID=A0AAU9L6H1_9STRA|nr:unnamed protein product [Peronospora belbahrii]